MALHAVHFYRDESLLHDTIARFLGEGLCVGEPALIIASPSHRDGIFDALRLNGFDAEQSRRNGYVHLVDAQKTLAAFAPAGRPDGALFEAVVGEAIRKACHGRSGCCARVYGEMVDLLWRQKQVGNAIRVEGLWNSLARSHHFHLYCSYAVDDISRETGDPHIHAICDQHSFVSFASARSES